MRPPQVRALTAAISAALALAAGGVLLYLRPTRDIDFLVLNDEVLSEVAAELVARRGTVAEGRLRRFPLEEGLLRRLMTIPARMRYDPHCYFVYEPGLSSWRDWEEHPAGRYPVVTNSLGIRRDGELLETPPDLRILVAGDSHVDGVCANAESFPALLEASLRSARPERTVEVVNAAAGGYDFYHYLGVLERFLELGHRPDLFVMVVFGGNDFTGVWLWHVFHDTVRPKTALERSRLTKRLLRDYGPEMGQAVHTAEYFRSRWRETGTALRMAYETTNEVRRICDAEGIGLLVVYLPSPLEVPGRASLERAREAAELLELTEEHLAVVGRLADAFLESLRAAGIEVLDLRPGFAESEGLLYWQRDLHLDLAGHRRVADLVRPWVDTWADR